MELSFKMPENKKEGLWGRWPAFKPDSTLITISANFDRLTVTDAPDKNRNKRYEVISDIYSGADFDIFNNDRYFSKAVDNSGDTCLIEVIAVNHPAAPKTNAGAKSAWYIKIQYPQIAFLYKCRAMLVAH